MVESITLYTAKICPYAQRTEIALEELGVNYTKYEVNLQNKPEWYAPKVNPASKVPAMAYGGPPVPPDQPSPDSVKIAESLVLIEFLADLFPDSHLLPKDPVLRAKARFFIENVGAKVTPAWAAFSFRGESPESFLNSLEAVQALLPNDKPFAVGDQFTNADIAVAPFLGRMYLMLRHGIGRYDQEDGQKVWQALHSERFARLTEYANAIMLRESFQKTFDQEYIKGEMERRMEVLKLKHDK